MALISMFDDPTGYCKTEASLSHESEFVAVCYKTVFRSVTFKNENADEPIESFSFFSLISLFEMTWKVYELHQFILVMYSFFLTAILPLQEPAFYLFFHFTSLI